MPDGIFDQRLNQQRRHANRSDIGRDIAFDADAIARSRALQFQVRCDRGEFLAQRRHPRAAGAQRISEHACQLQDQLLGALGLYRRRFRDHIERIEQKMMIELAAQRLELTQQRQLAKPQMFIARAAEREPSEDHVERGAADDHQIGGSRVRWGTGSAK